MKTKYLTLRAEFVERGKRDCELCIFSVTSIEGDYYCGIWNHPKFDSNNCENGYCKEIDLTK